MTLDNWADPNARSIAIYLDGRDCPDRADDGTFLVDDDFLVLVNSWWEPLDFVLPVLRPNQRWSAEFDTYEPRATVRAADLRAGQIRTVGPRSLVVLRAATKPSVRRRVTARSKS
jgi:glycogen operon protein